MTGSGAGGTASVSATAFGMLSIVGLGSHSDSLKDYGRSGSETGSAMWRFATGDMDASLVGVES